MNLLIDLGNTRLKWACHQNDQMNPVGGFEYDVDSLSTSYEREWSRIGKPEHVCIASDVNNDITMALKDWIEQHWQAQVHIIVPQNHAHGVKNAYQNPQQLGSDRWASLVAVKNKIKQPAIIVDCGTAITIDVITGGGDHLGGMILPGIQLMRDSLLKGTHKIDTLTGQKQTPLTALADNTFDGVRNGVLTAAVAFIKGAVEQIKPELNSQQDDGTQITNIITGGNADTLIPYLDSSFVQKPNLVLEGLAIILENKK